jgi:ABC-type Fe3+-siderophore transport system permease subunit
MQGLLRTLWAEDPTMGVSSGGAWDAVSVLVSGINLPFVLGTGAISDHDHVSPFFPSCSSLGLRIV